MLNDEQVKWIIRRMLVDQRTAATQAYFNGVMCEGFLTVDNGARIMRRAEQWATQDISEKRLNEILAQYKTASRDPDPSLYSNPASFIEHIGEL